MSAPIPEDPRGNYCVMIIMHTEDAARALTNPESVRMTVASALESNSGLNEEIDFTLDVYRTESDKDVTTERIAALEAQVEECGKEIEHWKSEAYSYKPAWDQMKVERAALEAQNRVLRDALLTEALPRIKAWAEEAYPEVCFPLPDWTEARERLGDSLLTRVSAANMRHVAKRMWEILEPVSAALAATETKA